MPENLPGLLYARKLVRRADSAGVRPRAEAADALDRVEQKADGLRREPGREEAFAALGEMLLAAVEVARALGVDPELAVRAAAGRLRSDLDGAAAVPGAAPVGTEGGADG